MKSAVLLLSLITLCLIGMAQETTTPDADKRDGSGAMCEAATQRLREANTNLIELAMTLDARGRVQSFTTVSPKGLRLEKMKKAADEIKAMQFQPATKEGRPVPVMITATFKCR